MLGRACLLALVVLTISCGSSEEVFVGELAAPVVYGTDDRREIFDHPDPKLRRIGRESIVALIPTRRLIREPSGDYGILTSSLKAERGLCDDEPFGNQPVAASCSGTLIDDDLVLTAGHCINGLTPCEDYYYVFDYYLDGPDQLASIRDEDVYTCRRLVLDEDPTFGAQTPDYAVIELDRPVEDPLDGDLKRQPVAFRSTSGLEQGDPIAMIGFPTGLPAKIDAGAAVASAQDPETEFFVANLDAFKGHSGSATFDSEGLLAGILLGGRVPDYVTADDEDCARPNVFEDSEAGEIVHKVGPIIWGLCEDVWSNRALCDTASCVGASCGERSSPTGSGGVTAAKSTDCSAASAGSTRVVSLWATLLLFVAARRLNRTSA